VPELLKPHLGFGLGERPSQRGFLVLKLRFQVGLQFGDNVVLPLPGQVLFHGLQITIK
jgi:hypothetical protein